MNTILFMFKLSDSKQSNLVPFHINIKHKPSQSNVRVN